MTVMFDTLKLAQELRDKADFSSKQAEGLAEALGHSYADNVATKTDIAELRSEIAELRTELKTEMAELRTELKTEMAELRTEFGTETSGIRADMNSLKAELLKWFIAILSGQAIFIITMIKLL